MLVLEIILDVFFLVDIISSFNTGFYKKGYLVMKRKDVMLHYLHSWFTVDAISSFPYQLILLAIDTVSLSTNLKSDPALAYAP